MHNERHPQAGQKVIIATDSGPDANGVNLNGQTYWIEDYWDHLTGDSWRKANVFATALYARRQAENDLPDDDEVVYGKISGLGHLVHVSELGEPVG